MTNEATRLTEHSPDDALRLGCSEGNPRAQEYLYRRWFGKLLGIPMRYTSQRMEAIEVLNMAFLKIFQSMQNFRDGDGASFSGWMARIVFNTTMDHVRKQTSYRRKHDFETEPDTQVQNDVLGHLAAEDVYHYVQQLPPATRSVFSLFALDGYKHREIAELLGIDEGTSRWHLGQARKTLRNLITDHYLNS